MRQHSKFRGWLLFLSGLVMGALIVVGVMLLLPKDPVNFVLEGTVEGVGTDGVGRESFGLREDEPFQVSSGTKASPKEPLAGYVSVVMRGFDNKVVPVYVQRKNQSTQPVTLADIKKGQRVLV